MISNDNIIMFSLGQNYNRTSYKYDYSLIKNTTNTKGSYFYGTSEQLKLMLNKNKADVDFTKLKKVFFSQSSSFPRFKLSQFTNIKRALKPVNAEVVIHGDYRWDKTYSDFLVFFSETENVFYHLKKHSLTLDYFKNKKINESSILNYLIDTGNISPDSKFVFDGPPIVLNSIILNDLELINSVSIPFVSENDLNNYINSLQDDPSDSIESISEFLESNDVCTVDLGLKLLNNFNVLLCPCTIGMLLIKNSTNVLRTNACNSVGFKNVLSTLTLTKDDLLRGNGEVNVKLVLDKLYKLSPSDGDKNEARNVILTMLDRFLEKSLNTYSSVIESMNIKVNIEIK